MSLPISLNNTCDIYRPGSAPPDAPDVAAVPCYLSSDFERRQEIGEDMDVGNKYTHVMLVDLTTDIRDGWNSFTNHGFSDIVYIPDQNGTAFRVTFVERKNRGQPGDHKKVYLNRKGPTWPTNNL
jgi:hypothetical protein